MQDLTEDTDENAKATESSIEDEDDIGTSVKSFSFSAHESVRQHAANSQMHVSSSSAFAPLKMFCSGWLVYF